MKYSYSAFALIFAGLAAAQIPACAAPCIADAVAKSTTCGAQDLVCQCTASNKAAIQGAATTCVIGACGATAALDVLSAANAACAANTGSSSSVAGSVTAPTVSPSQAPSTSASSSSSSVAPTTASTSTLTTSASAAPTTTSTAASTTAVAPAPASNTTAPIGFTGGSSQLLAGAGSFFVIGAAVIAAL